MWREKVKKITYAFTANWRQAIELYKEVYRDIRQVDPEIRAKTNKLLALN